MDKPRNKNLSSNEPNLGQKEAEREKDQMHSDEGSKAANLGQKDAEELADDDQDKFAEDDEE